MYTSGELEKASMAMDEPMKALSHRIMSDIVRRIRENGDITSAADWQINRLVQLGIGMAEIQAAINAALSETENICDALFSNVIKEGYTRDKKLYEAVGKVQIPFEDNAPLQQLISSVTAQTNETMHNITQSLGFAQRGSDGHLSFTPIADYYQRTLDKAMLDISSGAFDYNTVLKRTVKEMTDSGLRTVDYATGWSNRVNVAARRAVMTGMTQLTAQVNEQNAEALETEWFEISWHSGARPSHWWGGKWYTKEQLTTICKLGDVQGLCGANCYHDYSPVIPGISEPTYTEEELAELNRQEKESIEYNGKQYTKYEALQRQRRLETTMRAQRQEMQLLKEGGADEDDLINCRARYHGTSQEYTAFSKTMGLPQQRERVFADGLGNIMQGKTEGGSGKESPVSVPPVGAHVTGKVTAEERKELLSRNKVDIADNAKTVEKVSAVEETSGFKQAKTIEEAEKFALENGVRHVDYSDLPLETANLLNEAAMTLPEDIRPAYIGSGKSVQKVTGKKFSRKEKDYYGVHMDVLQMHFGEYPNIEYDFEGGNVVGISTAYKTPEKIHKSKVEDNKAYAEKHDGHTQFFNEDGRSTAFHEMGHIYADKKGIPEGFASDAERWLKESKCDMLKSTDEAWAEAWGAYHTKNPDLPDYIAEYVEKATNTPVNKQSIDNVAQNDIIKENKSLYPDALAGVKRGEPMSFEAADSGNVNPNYGQKGYDTNCQTCTIVNEARRRGYDVEALPNKPNSMAEKLSHQYTMAWINPETGKKPEFIVDKSKDTPKKYLEFMHSTIQPNERYIIGFTWKGKGNSGHIVNLDINKNGELRIKDNQRGAKERSEWIGDKAVMKYLKQMKWSETLSGYKIPKVPKMLRIDNLQFEPDVVKKIMKGREG